MFDSSAPYFISEKDTKLTLTWPDAIACLASAYGLYENPRAAPPRVVAQNGPTWLRSLAAISPSGRYMGVKMIAKARLPQVSYLIPLWDQETAHLACLMDGEHITAVRTAATSALAVDHLAPSQQDIRVAVLGSGSEATAHVQAVATIRKVKSLTVFSPTPKNREDFARKCSEELKIECHSADSAQAAVSQANLVIAAARSYDETPILEGAWLSPGMTVVSIGSTVPEQREVDPEVIRRADLIVADVPDEVMHETGDFLEARAAGVGFKDKVISLADLLQKKRPGRRRADDILLFKSVGSALQDIAVAEMCFEKARQSGLGVPLPMALSIKTGKQKPTTHSPVTGREQNKEGV